MLHFKPKLVGKHREREKMKIFIPFHSVPTLRIIENSKKIAKKFKKLRNTTMTSFQAKIGRKMLRKRDDKKYRSVSFLPDAKYKIKKKIAKKFKILKNTVMASFQPKNS